MNVPRRKLVGTAAVDRLTKAALRVLPDYPNVLAAYLHGSTARGEPAADLDVGVLLSDAAPNWHELDQVAARLQLEGAPDGPDLDLRPLTPTTPRFRANVLRDGRLLYEADRKARLTFEAQALSEWLDFKPIWERMRRRLFDRWIDG